MPGFCELCQVSEFSVYIPQLYTVSEQHSVQSLSSQVMTRELVNKLSHMTLQTMKETKDLMN